MFDPFADKNSSAPVNPQDWVIPHPQNASFMDAALDDGDFVIGHELLAQQGLTADAVLPDLEEVSRIEEMCFQDLLDDYFDAPESLDSAHSQSSWRNLASNSGEAHADIISPEGPVFAGVEPPEVSDEIIQTQKIRKLNDRVAHDCQDLLSSRVQIEKMTAEDVESLRNNIVLDRDLIEDQVETVQGWINKAILDGELEHMHHFNQVKNSLFETQSLLRRLGNQLFISEPEKNVQSPLIMVDSNPLSTPQVSASQSVSVPEMPLSPYAIPLKTRPHVSKKSQTDQKKIVVPQKSKGKSSATKKTIMVVLMVLLIPIAYHLSAQSGKAKKVPIDTYQYSGILLMDKAYVVQNNFIGQVQESWLLLKDEEKKRQLNDLIEVLKVKKYNSILLHYPDGESAANYLLGNIILY